MATAVAIGPGTATLTPALGGAVLRSVIGDAHILTTPSSTPPATSNGAPVDLTGASVKFVMRPAVVQGNPTVLKSPAVIVAPATGGVARYDWSAADTAIPGDYLAEWEVTDAAGRKQSFPTLTYHAVTILADLDGV